MIAVRATNPPTVEEIVTTFAETRLKLGKRMMPDAMKEKLIADASKLEGNAAIDCIENRFWIWERYSR